MAACREDIQDAKITALVLGSSKNSLQHQSVAGRWHLPHLSLQLLHSRTGSLACQASMCLAASTDSVRDHPVSYRPRALSSGQACLCHREKKVSGEPNSLYLWITTAAFNSLE